jgi:hypothetical protein
MSILAAQSTYEKKGGVSFGHRLIYRPDRRSLVRGQLPMALELGPYREALVAQRAWPTINDHVSVHFPDHQNRVP